MVADNITARATVLVVDDTPANIALLSGLLKDHYKVKVATSGEKALLIAAAEPPDLILLDIMMPQMNGYEVCKALKADPATREIPVMFLTAKAEAEDQELGLELGAVDYIIKPFSLPIVLARVKTHLALKAATDVLRGEKNYLEAEVTARKQAEEALLKAGPLQSAIFNSANFSSIATDAQGVIQIFNVGAERMLGYAAVDVMNKITPADISDPMELIVRAKALSVELGTPITPGFEALVFKASRGIEDIYELTYFRKDGSRFPAIVSVTALRDAQESIIGYLLIGTDNTARKQVEADQARLDQRLRDQQFYTRSLIESNIDALMTTDPQGIITDVNQQMIALTGYKRDELIGAPCRKFFTDPVSADAAIRRVLAENKLSDYELTVRARGGEETVVSYNAATFHNRDRKLQGVFAAARDITERKRSERALEETSQQLKHTLAFVEERNRDISLLGQMTGVLHSCLTVEETFTPIAKYCAQLFPEEAGAMYLMNKSGTFMEEVTHFGAWTQHEPVFVLEDCWAMRRGQLYAVNDPRSGILCKHVDSAHDGAHPYICLPMSAHHEISGLFHLQFGTAKAGEPALDKRLEAKRLIVIAMVEQITLSVANLKLRDTLRQQSTRDPLTGLYNRRFMEEFLEREFARARRRDAPLAFMIMDVDHFKQFNDTFGHEAGDIVLRELAGFIQHNVRDNDIVCRMGGEEFAVVMPEASAEIAFQRAERLREGAQLLELKLGLQALGKLSISIGIAAFPGHGDDFVTISAAADRALYQAKNSGRNKTIIAAGIDAEPKAA